MSLATERAIKSIILVRVFLSYYKDSPGASPSELELLFCDGTQNYVVEGKTYAGLGTILGITASRSELKGSSNEVTVSISGIPNTSMYGILNSRMKGAPIQISRAFYNPVTDEPLLVNGTSNVIPRYYGFINNYALQEEYDIMNRKSSNTIVLTCSSSIDLLGNKYVGRKTNPSSQNRYFSTDKSMDRVPNLENAFFDFGKKV